MSLVPVVNFGYRRRTGIGTMKVCSLDLFIHRCQDVGDSITGVLMV